MLLDRIPATSPLELRDRALFELAYACGLRAEELVTLDLGSVDFDSELVRVEGKGGKTRLVPAGEHALRALERYLARARPALVTDRADEALFLSKSGRRLSTSDIRRRLRTWARLAARTRSGARRYPSPCSAPLLRHPSARGRGRPARDPGVTWPRNYLDDSGLHSGRVGAAQAGLWSVASARLIGEHTLETNVKAIELQDLWKRYKATGDSARGSAWWLPTRRWSSTSPAGWAPACPPTSRSPTSSPTGWGA